jgi:hypothetical protein
MKKLRDLGSREDRNILEFEIDEILSNGQLLTLKALNSFSSRSFSFIVPVGGEGFTNLFLGLLDFPDRNAEMF